MAPVARRALAVAAPGVVVVVASLAWAVVDRIHLHLKDRTRS